MLLQKIENEHEISRWTPSCQAYKETKEVMKSKLKKKLKIQIRQYARERWFLLRLKSKYAGMYNLNVHTYVCHVAKFTDLSLFSHFRWTENSYSFSKTDHCSHQITEEVLECIQQWH